MSESKKKAKPKTKKKTEKKPKAKKEEPVELEAEQDLGEETPIRLEAEAEEKKQLVKEVEATSAEETTGSAEEEPVGAPEPAKPVEAPVEAEEPEEEEEEGLEIVEEKYYDLNLRRVWTTPRKKRTPRAIRYVRDFVARRMKSDEVSISEEANILIWARGISKPPRHLRLRVVKDKEDRVIIFPGEAAPKGTEPVKAEAETS